MTPFGRTILDLARHLEAIANRIGSAALMAGFAGLAAALALTTTGPSRWAAFGSAALLALWSAALFVSILPLFLEELLTEERVGNRLVRMALIVPTGLVFGFMLCTVAIAGFEGVRALADIRATLAP